MHTQIDKYLPVYRHEAIQLTFFREIINSILSSDWDLTKMANFHIRPETNTYRKWTKGIINKHTFTHNRFIPKTETNEQIN